MKLEVEVTSRESIKPSSPTPPDLNHYNLSFLDQIAPPVYMPLVLYYEPSDTHSPNPPVPEERSELLKKSLSESLTRFYPLAGRVKDNSYVDCNDEGAELLQAQVKCKLSEVITNPVPSELDKLLPRQLDDVDVLFAVQVNYFDCGGLAIGVCISHKVADGFSYFTFVKSWAATARGDEDGVIYPEFDGSELFPPRELSGYEPNMGIRKDNIVTKRFAFTNPNILALKDKCANSLNTEDPKPPTRIEAVSSFIWNRFATATKTTSGPNTLYFILHTVNLRARMDPPLADNHFGNMLAVAITKLPAKPSGDGIVEQMRDAIGKIDGEYIKRFKEGDEYLRFLRASGEKFNKGDMVTFNFTSLCRFPLYEADFGWGKPFWVSSVAQVFKNLVVFMDSWSGDGIEAWVTLEEEDMDKFEVDEEMRGYAT